MLARIFLAALVALCLSGVALGQSQQPSPSAGETTGKNQQLPAGQQQPATDDKRGTKEAPLIIEMTNPPNGDAIASEIKKNREDQATENWRSVVFSSLLVIVGFLQGGAIIYTALVTNPFYS